MSTQQWTVADAKARFSEVLERAETHGPQTITRRGRKAVIIVSAREWERKTRRRGTLADFFAGSPLRGAQLELSRVPAGVRKVEL